MHIYICTIILSVKNSSKQNDFSSTSFPLTILTLL